MHKGLSAARRPLPIAANGGPGVLHSICQIAPLPLGPAATKRLRPETESAVVVAARPVSQFLAFPRPEPAASPSVLESGLIPRPPPFVGSALRPCRVSSSKHILADRQMAWRPVPALRSASPAPVRRYRFLAA